VLVKILEEVISNDLLLARGWSPRRVALASYGITAALASIARFGLLSESPQFLVMAALSLIALFVAARRLGSLRRETMDSPIQRERA